MANLLNHVAFDIANAIGPIWIYPKNKIIEQIKYVEDQKIWRALPYGNTHPPNNLHVQINTQEKTKTKIDKYDNVDEINWNKLPQEGIINVNVPYRLVWN